MTTVGQAVEALARRKWPGCTLLYNNQVIADYLKGQAFQADPLFFLAPVKLLMMLYLRGCYVEPLSERDREVDLLNSVAWIARLAFLTSPDADYWLGVVPPALDPRRVWSLEEPGPVSVQSSEWPIFRNTFTKALRHGLVSLGSQSYRYGLNQTIYSLPDADRLANGLLNWATPFPKDKGRIVVIHCNDPGSMRALRAAEDVVSGELPPDLELALAGHLLAPKAAAAGRSSAVEDVLRTENRNLGIYLGRFTGSTNREIAEWLLDTKLIIPRQQTESGDSVESAERQVRGVWNNSNMAAYLHGDAAASEVTEV